MGSSIQNVNDRWYDVGSRALHEIGHVVFANCLSVAEKGSIDSIFRELIELESRTHVRVFDAVTDIYYKQRYLPGFSLEYSGHPYSSPDELFASAFMINLNFGRDFIAAINGLHRSGSVRAAQLLLELRQIVLKRL